MTSKSAFNKARIIGEPFHVVTFDKTAFEVTAPSTVGGTQDGTQGTTLDIWIEEQIRKNPNITTEELVEMSKKGLRTIKRHIAKLTHIKCVGSGYSGCWEIVENNTGA